MRGEEGRGEGVSSFKFWHFGIQPDSQFCQVQVPEVECSTTRHTRTRRKREVAGAIPSRPVLSDPPSRRPSPVWRSSSSSSEDGIYTCRGWHGRGGCVRAGPQRAQDLLLPQVKVPEALLRLLLSRYLIVPGVFVIIFILGLAPCLWCCDSHATPRLSKAQEGAGQGWHSPGGQGCMRSCMPTHLCAGQQPLTGLQCQKLGRLINPEDATGRSSRPDVPCCLLSMSMSLSHACIRPPPLLRPPSPSVLPPP